MKYLKWPWLRETDKSLYNPRLITLVIIVAGLTALYYVYFYTDIDAYGDWREWLWHLEVFEFRNDLNGGLFYLPFLYAALMFWWRGVLITWLVSMVLMLPHIIDYSSDIASLLSNIFFLLVPLMIVSFISLEMKWREKERSTLAEREGDRQVYMSQIFKAQENERQRIAQELHDDTTQSLLVIANRVQSLVADECIGNHPHLKENAEWVRDAILSVSEDMRRLSLDLRPAILDNLGLIPALRWLVNRLMQEGEIDAKIVIRGDDRKLNLETEVIIFRIVQEALNNIRRHSGATKAVVVFEFAPDTIRLKVRDNGKGFHLPQTIGNLPSRGKLGIIGMLQRSKLLNGTFDISSEPGKGTTVVIEAKI